MGLTREIREPVWLCDFDVGGRVYRWATKATAVTNEAGDTFQYMSGLSPLALGSTRTLARRTVRVRAHTNDDWPGIAARGIPLERRRVVVRYWLTGQTLEQAEVFLDGETERVKFDEQGTPVELEVVEDPTYGALTLPPAQAAATDETWPVNAGFILPVATDGQIVPVVIGYPGDHPKGAGITDIAEAAVRAPYVERQDPYVNGTGDKYAVAFGKVDAAQVQMYDYDGVTASFAAAQPSTATTADSLGQATTTITQALLDVPEAAEIWVGFRNASGWGGGLKSPYSSGVLRGAGEVARYILDYFAAERLDLGRMRAYQPWMDRFKVDAAIMERQNPVEWLLQNVLAYLPVLPVVGPQGLYFAPMKWDATSIDAVAHLDADNGMVSRVGRPEIWREPIYNLFTLDYRPVRGGAQWASRRVLSSVTGNLYDITTSGANLPPFSTSLPWMATSENDARIYGSALCRWSQSQEWGVREWEIQHKALWDDTTAALILYYASLKHAVPKRLVSYEGGLDLRSLSPGQVVTVTDSDIDLAAQVGIVLERMVSTTSVQLEIVLLEHPFQTARATS